MAIPCRLSTRRERTLPSIGSQISSREPSRNRQPGRYSAAVSVSWGFWLDAEGSCQRHDLAIGLPRSRFLSRVANDLQIANVARAGKASTRATVREWARSRHGEKNLR